jgi:D-psicose/D-tagatose/L-ribulose 3-epimerase
MKFGVCGGPEIGRIAKAAGYDYFEWSVSGLLHPREDEETFEAALEQARAVGLACPAVNVFIPSDFKITGPDVDHSALEGYVTTAIRRANQAGVEVIVFGSGGARRIPDGFSRERAWQQLSEFCCMIGPIAQKYQVTAAIEPLNKTETNVLNTVDEAAKLVREVEHPNIRLLVDGYHWAKDGDSLAGILDNASLIAHAHVATLDGRRPPHPGDNCAPFFAALKQAGYDGRVSIEGNIEDPQVELPRALEIMRAVWGGLG